MASKRTALIPLFAWLALIVVACGGSAPAAGAPAPTQLRSSGGSGDGGEGQPASGDGQANFLPANDTAFIVRTGSLDIEVRDLQSTLTQAHALISGLGGYIAASKEAGDGQNAYAQITYRIPVDRWFDALSGLRALGTRVVAENTEASDVTADVVDMDARLTNLHAAETQYQAIMAQATTIDDVLKVQKVLTDTRGEIERLQAQRDNLADRAALATLTVGWQVPTTATSVANQGWDAGREIDRAFAALTTFAQGLVTLAIWLAIAFLPILLPLALVTFVVVRIARRKPNRVTMEADTPADG